MPRTKTYSRTDPDGIFDRALEHLAPHFQPWSYLRLFAADEHSLDGRKCEADTGCNRIACVVIEHTGITGFLCFAHALETVLSAKEHAEIGKADRDVTFE